MMATKEHRGRLKKVPASRRRRSSPMAKKRRYQTVSVQEIRVEQLCEGWSKERPVVVAIDVAKRKFVASVGPAEGPAKLVHWQHPQQTGALLSIIEELQRGGYEVEAVMEPTGTYGDALRYQLYARDVAVYRVNPKHTHDAAEVFDGVPKSHDAKAAELLAWLHAQRRSARWEPKDAAARALRAAVDRREVHGEQLQRCRGKLEALLARHFPELEGVLDVDGRSSLKLLAAYRSPAEIAAHPEQVRELLWKASRGRIGAERAAAVVQAARSTQGTAMIEDERLLMQALVEQMLECLSKLDEIDTRLDEMLHKEHESLAEMRRLLGPVTTAVLVAFLGNPAQYGSSRALEKACGLNLRADSSGESRRPLKISKRGPAVVRKFLFLAALRLIQSDATMAQWYRRRSGHTEKHKLKAVIAVMRKLCRALVHVARGAKFNSSLLVDTRRLGVSGSALDVCQEAAMPIQ